MDYNVFPILNRPQNTNSHNIRVVIRVDFLVNYMI